MKLSFIIALYNTERFIEKCLTSIYDQNSLDIDDFEVIVIDDGSTDGSPNIVRRFQKNFSNIQLISKENGGQSSARNVGFNIAKGDYVFCLDSDDFIDSKELNRALNYCYEHNLDLLPIFLQKFDENYNLIPYKGDNYEIMDGIIDGGRFLNNNVVYGSMCRYFYKRNIITKYNLKLTEGIFHEDEEFITKFISYCKIVSYRRHMVYNQVVRSNSTMTKSDSCHRIRLLKDLTTVLKNLDVHRTGFDQMSVEYSGISKKIEQLLISLFLRMKADRINNEERESIIANLEKNKLYPLKIKYSPLKFKIISKLYNSRLFKKIYYR